MLLHSLVTQSTYGVILCLPCATLKSFMRRETIWSFDPCHKNLIFVWFLHGCPLNKAGKKWLATSIQVKKLPQKMEFVCIDASATAADAFMLFDTESLNFSSRRCLLLWFRDWHTHADWNQCSETVEGK